jgi:hypothetical protein
LAAAFHRKRAAILRYVMEWGLTHGKAWTIDRSIPAASRSVNMLVTSELLEQVQDAAKAHDASVAAWLREPMRRITVEDFPGSWRAGEPSIRSHDSGSYRHRFVLRLDDGTSSKLETVTQTFQRSAAEVIRQLIAQARPEDFPARWQLAVRERLQEGDTCIL